MISITYLEEYTMTNSKFQIVGSLLRPQNLLDYRKQIEVRDDITYPFYDALDGYETVEAEAIAEAVKNQLDHGIDIVTDGEQGRSFWHLDFLWGFDGIERTIDQGYVFHDHDGGSFETRKDTGLKITGPLSGKNHHFLDIYKQVKENAEDTDVKLCIWSPAHAYTELVLFKELFGEGEFYATKEELKQDFINSYKEFLLEYKEAGGKIIQFDDCLWELFADDNEDSFFADSNDDVLLGYVDEFVAINNEVIDYGHDIGLKVWTHNCRGNYASRSACGGSYQAIAEKFLHDQHYDRFFLEWDDERAGDIEALSVLKDNEDVEVVLGLLSSKTATLDDEDRVIRLLDQATEFIPKDRLYLSHQCGFASCDCGNELSQEQQWAKIDQGQSIAARYFG